MEDRSLKKRRVILAVLAVAVALAGLVISGILLQHHVVARIGGDPLLEGTCRATDSFDCDEVIASKWGSFQLGSGERSVIIPTAMIGFAYFAALAAWFIAVALPYQSRSRLHLVPTLACAVGLLGAILFEYVMFFVLDKICPLCVATHVAILLLLAISFMLWRSSRRRHFPAGEESPISAGQAAPSASAAILTAVLLAVTVSAAGWFMYQSRLHEGYSKEYFARWQDYEGDTQLVYERFMAQPQVEIAITEDDPVLGPPDARHTVVVFSDFLCPMCKGLELGVIEQRRKEFPDRFRVVFKHFPLDKTCNPELTRTLHPNACAAAVAVEAVRVLKGDEAFWAMHEAMFHNSGKFTQEFAIREAEKLGISREDYLAQFKTTSVWSRIHANVAEARKLGLNSTPVIYFDGRPLKPWGDRHMWRRMLAEDRSQESGVSSQ